MVWGDQEQGQGDQEGEEDLRQVVEGAGDLPWAAAEEGVLSSWAVGEEAGHPSLEAEVVGVLPSWAVGEGVDLRTLEEEEEGAGLQTLEEEEGEELVLTVIGGWRSLGRAGPQPRCCASCTPPSDLHP